MSQRSNWKYRPPTRPRKIAVSRRTAVIAICIVVLASLVLVAYPACVRARSEQRADDEGCSGRDDQPPGPGFYGAVDDDSHVAAFPGFGHSDEIANEAVYCTITFSQACLLVERAAEPVRRETCERWREFAGWFNALGPDPPNVCRACPELRPSLK